MGGASEPPTPAEPAEPAVAQPLKRILTCTAGKRKPSRRVRDILSSFIEILDDEISEKMIMMQQSAMQLKPPSTHQITLPP
jgi:hypothetical protein